MFDLKPPRIDISGSMSSVGARIGGRGSHGSGDQAEQFVAVFDGRCGRGNTASPSGHWESALGVTTLVLVAVVLAAYAAGRR